MNRRQALSRVALIMGGTVVGANLFLEGCKPADKKADEGKLGEFAPEDVAYLDEVAETIIPATSTPGAKDAKVGAFMTVMVRDCYTEKDQKTFRNGMDKLNDAADKKFEKAFMALTPEQRKELLMQVDGEMKKYYETKKDDDDHHYFRLMKELTLLGFFTSEPGATKALRYVESPGRYDGCIPYEKGQKAWAL